MLNFDIMNYCVGGETSLGTIPEENMTKQQMLLNKFKSNDNLLYSDDLKKILEEDLQYQIPYLSGQLKTGNRDYEQLNINEVNLVVFIKSYRNKFELKTYLELITTNITRITFINSGNSLDPGTLNFLDNLLEILPHDVDINIPSLITKYGNDRFLIKTLAELYKGKRKRSIRNLTLPLNYLGLCNSWGFLLEEVLPKVEEEIIFTNSYIDFSDSISNAHCDDPNIEIVEYDENKEKEFKEIIEGLLKIIRTRNVTIMTDLPKDFINDNILPSRNHNRKFNLCERLAKSLIRIGNINKINLIISEDKLEDLIQFRYCPIEIIDKLVILTNLNYDIPNQVTNLKNDILDYMKYSFSSDHLTYPDIKKDMIEEYKEMINKMEIITVLPVKIVNIKSDNFIQIIDRDRILDIELDNVSQDFILDLNKNNLLKQKYEINNNINTKVVNSLESIVGKK